LLTSLNTTPPVWALFFDRFVDCQRQLFVQSQVIKKRTLSWSV